MSSSTPPPAGSSPFIPEFNGPIEGYVVNFLAKNLWRVKTTHTHDEAMQEAYLVFLTIVTRYPNLDTPQHFMALFKTAWDNHFHDLSKASTTARTATPASQLTHNMDGEEQEMNLDRFIGETDNSGFLAVMVKQAPKEVMMVLNLMLNAPQELLELAQRTWRTNGKYRADGERLTEKMLGLPPGTEPLRQTKEYFTHKN